MSAGASMLNEPGQEGHVILDCMPRHDLLLHTKLTPPRLHSASCRDAKLIARLREALDYRLTLVQAGTGYGKSTALAALADEDVPLSGTASTKRTPIRSVSSHISSPPLNRACPICPKRRPCCCKSSAVPAAACGRM